MRNGTKLWFGCGLVGVLALGCGPLTKPPRWSAGVRNISAGQESLSESADDHYERVYQVYQHDGRGLAEDMDMMLLTDRPSRLNRWHDR